jgi:hypothetical protein
MEGASRIARALRQALSVQPYLVSAGPAIARGRELVALVGRRDERLVFVTVTPPSGTTFPKNAPGAVSGLLDLAEVLPLEAVLPELAALADGSTVPDEGVATRIRAVLERVPLLGGR